MDTAEYDPQRPTRLEEMAGASDWVRLRSVVKGESPPHVVLVGPAGVGKSCALRLVLGPAITMWLQCSQDPTLRDSRDRIKAAARRRVEEGRVNWIVLEHADMLHADAQAFLRRIIETTIGASRFVLEVRDIAAIAEPLLSRTVLFQSPCLVEHEIRAEVMRRAPAVSLEVAGRIAAQSETNLRWAILQGLGGGDGCVATEVAAPEVTSWADLLHAMEAVQQSGTSPRLWLGKAAPPTAVWERPGGACPWALLAHTLAKSL